VRATLEIAERCDLELKQRWRFPLYAVRRSGRSDELRRAARAGLDERLNAQRRLDAARSTRRPTTAASPTSSRHRADGSPATSSSSRLHQLGEGAGHPWGRGALAAGSWWRGRAHHDLDPSSTAALRALLNRSAARCRHRRRLLLRAATRSSATCARSTARTASRRSSLRHAEGSRRSRTSAGAGLHLRRDRPHHEALPEPSREGLPAQKALEMSRDGRAARHGRARAQLFDLRCG